MHHVLDYGPSPKEAKREALVIQKAMGWLWVIQLSSLGFALIWPLIVSSGIVTKATGAHANGNCGLAKSSRPYHI